MSTIISISIILGWIVIVLFVAVICRQYFPAHKELSRKIVHIGTGPIIPLAWRLGISSSLAIPIASTITVALLLNHQLRLLPALEDVNRQSYGTIAYGFSITFLLIFLWPENAAAVSAGVLVMSFGDGFAGLIGRQFHSPQWKIFGQRKSMIGTVTMALTSLFILVLITINSGLSIHLLPLIALTCTATSLEQIGPWGIDNITVPIGVAYGWLLLQA